MAKEAAVLHECGPRDKFGASLEWGIGIEWFDLDGMHDLGDGRLARLTIDDAGFSGHYSGVRVRILSKTHGEVEAKRFGFADYMPADERADNRRDYEGGFHAWTNQGRTFEWYIAVPKSTRRFCAAVERFIDLFRVPQDGR